jgi:hypothetical protein
MNYSNLAAPTIDLALDDTPNPESIKSDEEIFEMLLALNLE